MEGSKRQYPSIKERNYYFKEGYPRITRSDFLKILFIGQLFGIIRHGSPGTQMTAYDLLEDNQIWQLVLYIRQFAR